MEGQRSELRGGCVHVVGVEPSDRLRPGTRRRIRRAILSDLCCARAPGCHGVPSLLQRAPGRSLASGRPEPNRMPTLWQCGACGSSPLPHLCRRRGRMTTIEAATTEQERALSRVAASWRKATERTEPVHRERAERAIARLYRYMWRERPTSSTGLLSHAFSDPSEVPRVGRTSDEDESCGAVCCYSSVASAPPSSRLWLTEPGRLATSTSASPRSTRSTSGHPPPRRVTRGRDAGTERKRRIQGRRPAFRCGGVQIEVRGAPRQPPCGCPRPDDCSRCRPGHPVRGERAGWPVLRPGTRGSLRPSDRHR